MAVNEKLVMEIVADNALTKDYNYAFLQLPATKIEIENAMQKADVAEGRWKEFNIVNCPFIPILTDQRLDCPTIDELNFFAQRLTELNDEELMAINALFCYTSDNGDFENGAGMKDLINMTYGLDKITIHHGITSDEMLGEAVIDGEFEEYIKEMPDEAIEFLDKKKVGANYREKTRGYFYRCNYVDLCEYEYPQIYDGITLPEPMKYEYGDGVFYIRVSKAPQNDEESYRFSETAEWISLPMTDDEIQNCLNKLGETDMRNLAYYEFKSPFTGITDETFDSMDLFYELNNISKDYLQLSDIERQKFKALTEEFEPDFGVIREYFDELDHYAFFPHIKSVDMYSKLYMGGILPTNFDLEFLDTAVLMSFGEKLMKKFSNKINKYGLLSGKDRNVFEIVTYENETEEQETQTMKGMEM